MRQCANSFSNSASARNPMPGNAPRTDISSRASLRASRIAARQGNLGAVIRFRGEVPLEAGLASIGSRARDAHQHPAAVGPEHVPSLMPTGRAARPTAARAIEYATRSRLLAFAHDLRRMRGKTTRVWQVNAPTMTYVLRPDPVDAADQVRTRHHLLGFLSEPLGCFLD